MGDFFATLFIFLFIAGLVTMGSGLYGAGKQHGNRRGYAAGKRRGYAAGRRAGGR